MTVLVLGLAMAVGSNGCALVDAATGDGAASNTCEDPLYVAVGEEERVIDGLCKAYVLDDDVCDYANTGKGSVLYLQKPAGDWQLCARGPIGSVLAINDGSAECSAQPIASCLMLSSSEQCLPFTVTPPSTGVRVYWEAETDSAGDCGALTLRVIEAPESDCLDGTDNDGDGAFDCADSGCRSASPETCNSGIGPEVCDGRNEVDSPMLPGFADELACNCVSDDGCVGLSQVTSEYVCHVQTDGVGVCAPRCNDIDVCLEMGARCAGSSGLCESYTLSLPSPNRGWEWGNARGVTTPYGYEEIEIVDLDDDGINDIALANGGGFAVLFANGDGTFSFVHADVSEYIMVPTAGHFLGPMTPGVATSSLGEIGELRVWSADAARNLSSTSAALASIAAMVPIRGAGDDRDRLAISAVGKLQVASYLTDPPTFDDTALDTSDNLVTLVDTLGQRLLVSTQPGGELEIYRLDGGGSFTDLGPAMPPGPAARVAAAGSWLAVFACSGLSGDCFAPAITTYGLDSNETPATLVHTSEGWSDTGSAFTPNRAVSAEVESNTTLVVASNTEAGTGVDLLATLVGHSDGRVHGLGALDVGSYLHVGDVALGDLNGDSVPEIVFSVPERYAIVILYSIPP